MFHIPCILELCKTPAKKIIKSLNSLNCHSPILYFVQEVNEIRFFSCKFSLPSQVAEQQAIEGQDLNKYSVKKGPFLSIRFTKLLCTYMYNYDIITINKWKFLLSQEFVVLRSLPEREPSKYNTCIYVIYILIIQIQNYLQ